MTAPDRPRGLTWRSASRVLAGAVVLIMVAYLIMVAPRRPSLDRTWDEDVAVLAGVEPGSDGGIHLTDVRDWRYTRESIVSKRYFDRTYHPDDIVGMWLYEQPLDGVGLIAHTFLVFEFDPSYGPDRWLGLSVETRREADEDYSIVLGMLRAFEVTHIWAKEDDLVRRRVEYLDYPLRRYRLDIPAAYQARIFAKMTEETRELSENPRWYHTALHNCTSSLIRYVNESEPDAIPLHYSYVLTGKIDEYLEQLGYLDRASGEDITRDFIAHQPLR